jgi:hypothetical protein
LKNALNYYEFLTRLKYYEVIFTMLQIVKNSEIILNIFIIVLFSALSRDNILPLSCYIQIWSFAKGCYLTITIFLFSPF